MAIRDFLWTRVSDTLSTLFDAPSNDDSFRKLEDWAKKTREDDNDAKLSRPQKVYWRLLTMAYVKSIAFSHAMQFERETEASATLVEGVMNILAPFRQPAAAETKTSLQELAGLIVEICMAMRHDRNCIYMNYNIGKYDAADWEWDLYDGSASEGLTSCEDSLRPSEFPLRDIVISPEIWGSFYPHNGDDDIHTLQKGYALERNNPAFKQGLAELHQAQDSRIEAARKKKAVAA